MKKRVYIETSIVSYLTARPSPILVIAAHQQVTREWWAERRQGYACFISEFVTRESAKGDPEMAKSRLAAIAGLPMVRIEDDAIVLAEQLVAEGFLPEKAATDAMHLSLAAVHGMHVLLTWNCRHLANAAILGDIGQFVRMKEYEMPVVCTPDELMGDTGGLGD
jgi:hypothetical protein